MPGRRGNGDGEPATARPTTLRGVLEQRRPRCPAPSPVGTSMPRAVRRPARRGGAPARRARLVSGDGPPPPAARRRRRENGDPMAVLSDCRNAIARRALLRGLAAAAIAVAPLAATARPALAAAAADLDPTAVPAP